MRPNFALDLQIAVKTGLVKRLELSVDDGQRGQMDEVRRRGGGCRQHLHKGVDFGAVGQVNVERAHLPRETGAEVGQLFQIAAALCQHKRVGGRAGQKPLDQCAAHIAGGTGD